MRNVFRFGNTIIVENNEKAREVMGILISDGFVCHSDFLWIASLALNFVTYGDSECR